MTANAAYCTESPGVKKPGYAFLTHCSPNRFLFFKMISYKVLGVGALRKCTWENVSR